MAIILTFELLRSTTSCYTTISLCHIMLRHMKYLSVDILLKVFHGLMIV